MSKSVGQGAVCPMVPFCLIFHFILFFDLSFNQHKMHLEKTKCFSIDPALIPTSLFCSYLFHIYSNL